MLGSGFDSFDGGAGASRCRFGTVEVEVAPGSLHADGLACISPPAVSLEHGNTTLRPAEGVQYFWADPDVGDTDQALAWRPDLSVALNAIDFRGGLPFVYYHQVRIRVRVRVRP